MSVAATIRVPQDHAKVVDAIAASKDGDTILIADGDYPEAHIRITNSITIRSEHGRGATRLYSIGREGGYMDMQRFITVSGSGGVNIIGLTIDGPGAVFYGSTISFYAKNCKVSDCVLNGSGHPDGYVYAVVVGGTVENCSICNISAPGFTAIEGAAVNRCIIANNVSRRYSKLLVNCSVTNSTIYGNWALVPDYFQTDYYDGAGRGGNFENCIIWGNFAKVYTNAGGFYYITQQLFAPLSVNHCIVEGGAAGAQNLNMNPTFVDPVNGDFRLQPNSPAIDGGNPARGSDPDGSRVDIGALPFLYQPWLSFVKAVKPSFAYLSVGTAYQLQLSGDMSTWTNHGAPFAATNASVTYPQYWDLGQSNKVFFRLREIQ